MVCFENRHCDTVSREGLPVAWAGLSADLVEAIEDPGFPDVLSRSLGALIRFDDCTQVVFDGGNKPIPLGCHGQDGPPGTAGRPDSRYRLHPFYPVYRSGVTSGVYLLDALVRCGDLAPRTGGPAGESRELCIALPLPGGGCALAILTRRRNGDAFTDEEAARLRLVLSFLTSVFRRYWQTVGVHAHSRDLRTDRTLQRIGRLSPREKEIVGLLIDGHSTLSISLRLDISGTTVKTHRKNLYSKLGVGTLSELFSLYGNSIKHQMAHSY